MFSLKGRKLKHVGKRKLDGMQLAILMKQLPDDPLKAWVLVLDSMADHDRLEVIKILEMQSSQNKENFSDALHDAGILNILHKKYQNKAMRAMDIDQIIMTPSESHEFELREVLNMIRDQNHQPRLPQNNTINTNEPEKPVQVQEDETGSTSNDPQDNSGIAKNLLMQAELLEADANKKREEAYSLDSSLKPKAKRSTTPRTKTTKSSTSANRTSGTKTKKTPTNSSKKVASTSKS